MKVLGIVCSPRRGGNTEILVQEALASARQNGAEEIELLTLAGKDIAPCDGCDICQETGKCVINDDMQVLYSKMLQADGIVFGSPVYFWGVTAQAKALIDRTYCLASGHRALLSKDRRSGEARQKGLRHKAAGIIVVARRAGGTSAFTQLGDFIRIHRMVDAGGAIAYGDEKGGVRRDEQGLREARWTGRAVVRAIRRTQGAEKATA